MTKPSDDQNPANTNDDDTAFAPALAGAGRKVNPTDAVDDDADPHVDRQLDRGLKETFPASDPVSINPGAD